MEPVLAVIVSWMPSAVKLSAVGLMNYGPHSAGRCCTLVARPRDRALRAAATVDTTGLSAERRARMLIDVAHAQAQRGKVHEAVAALREAEEITSEQVRRESHITPAAVSTPVSKEAIP
jgi:hypothetical protein